MSSPDSPVPDFRQRFFTNHKSIPLTLPFPFPPPTPEAVPTPEIVSIRYLEIKDTDVESDETLWGLYERWITHAEVLRSIKEKQKRFPAFKENAKYVHLENKSDNFPYELKLNKYSDMTTEEFDRTLTTANIIMDFKHLEIKDSDLQSNKSLQHLYKLWMTRYRMSRSPNEKLKRFAIFKETVKHIHSENKKGHIYKLGLNQFSDMTAEEIEKEHMGASPSKLLERMDMIMNMGGVLSKHNSDQGKMDGPRLTLDGYKVITPNDEKALEEAVRRHGPVGVFIDAYGDTFKNYRGGVLTEESGKEPGFTVNINGYGVTPYGVMFWEIQNWWGPLWGEGGFMRIKRGVNMCGISSFASLPIINKESSSAFYNRGRVLIRQVTQ